jgi:hypothetical protein
MKECDASGDEGEVAEAATRVYRYGCRSPIEGADLLDEQFRRAHHYRNGLVEIEHRRRAGIAEAQRAHDVLGPLLEVVHSTETTVAEARILAALARSGAGDPGEVAAQRELIEVARADLSVLRWLLGWCRSRAKTDEALLIAYAAVQEKKLAEVRLLRAGGDAPYWGTYLIVEKAAQAWQRSREPPRFHRYDGQGRVAVQLQGGLTVAEALGGDDTRLRIEPARQIAPPDTGSPRYAALRIVYGITSFFTCGNARMPRGIARAIAYGVVLFCRAGDMTPVGDYATCRIRIGSDGRRPVWAALPVAMHRPLPADGAIKWAWIVRRRCGLRYEYELQVTVGAESFRSAGARPGMIAIDVGCRDLPDGRLRIATSLDAGGERGELMARTARLSSSTSRGRKSGGRRRRRIVPELLDKAEDVRSIRDKHLDEVKIWLGGHRRVTIDEWFLAKTEHVMRWRSPARVAVLYRDWQRHAGDEEVYAAVSAYLSRDRHLLDWESRERRGHLMRRRERYREFAARVAERYGTVVIAERDYRREERPVEEAVSTDGHGGRTIMRRAAPGELRDEIVRAVKKRGGTVVEVRIEGDTVWALDWKVCARMLASDEVARSRAVLLEGVEMSGSRGVVRPSTRRRRLGRAESRDPLAGQDVTARVGS